MQTGRVILTSALTAVIVSAGTFFALRSLVTERAAASELVEVPPLAGLRPDQARTLLDPRGLALIVSEGRADPKVEAGQIVQQSPIEGSRVKRGSEVRVVLSTGQARVEVPAIVRMPLSGAMQVLSSAGLRVGEVKRQPDAQAPADQVIASSPAAGEKVARGSAVDLVVAGAGAASASGDEVKVPSLIGKTPAQAGTILGAAGLKLGKTTYGADEDRRGGVIIRQTPAPDASAARGSAVNIVVNEDE
jgi:serine/threonine-protein kinase